jgi:hypothetical protein
MHERIRLFGGTDFEQCDGKNGVDTAQYISRQDEEQQAGMVPIEYGVSSLAIGSAP